MRFPLTPLLGVTLVAASIGPASPPTAAPQSSTFSQLLEQYRHGDADAAVHEFATWSAARVEREATSMDSVTDLWQLAAFALFHAEAGLENDTLGDIAAGERVLDGSPRTIEPHARALAAAAERLSTSPTATWQNGLRKFCEQLYVLFERYDFLFIGRFPEQLWGRMSDSPAIATLLGARSVHNMGPEFDNGLWGLKAIGPTQRTSHGVMGTPQYASQWFGRAIALDERFAEAHLRLGHVLFMMDNVAPAREELQKALNYGHEQGNNFTAYLAALLLGRISEDKRQFQPALDAYRLASREYAGGQVSRIALGRLLVSQGQREAGWAAVREGLTVAETRSGSDPWYHYADGTIPWQFAARVAELRQVLRR